MDLLTKESRQIALQRSFELRGLFMAQVLLYDKDKFVWLDETGCNNSNYMRKYGYAIRGETPHCHTMLVRGICDCSNSMFASVGIPVFFLPPYSPDYNPIEETFSYLKAYL